MKKVLVALIVLLVVFALSCICTAATPMMDETVATETPLGEDIVAAILPVTEELRPDLALTEPGTEPEAAPQPAQLNEVTSGTCGGGLTWDFDTDTGVLTISGSGSLSTKPWSDYASQIKEIQVDDKVTSISSGVFSGCSNLERIKLPFVGPSAGGAYPFGYIFGTSAYTGGEATEQYYGSGTKVTYYIPASLTTVEITGGVVPYSGFIYCSHLTTVILSDKITSIGSQAFYSCRALTSVNIPKGVTSLSWSTFASTALRRVEIHKDLVSINDRAFSGTDVQEFVVAEDNPAYTVVDGILFSKDMTKLCIFPVGTGRKAYTLPDSVTSFGTEAFPWNAVAHLYTSKENKTAITNYGAFGGVWHCGYTGQQILTLQVAEDSQEIISLSASQCYKGETLFIRPKTRPEAGNDLQLTADHGTTKGYMLMTDESGDFDSITVGVAGEIPIRPDMTPAYSGSCGTGVFWDLYSDGVLYINGGGQMNNYNNSYSKAPWRDSSIEYSVQKVVLGEGVTSVGDYAFYFGSVSQVRFPSTLTQIGKCAFVSCKGIVKLELPKSLASVDEAAFDYCDGLTDVYWALPNRTGLSISSYNTKLTSATWHYNCSITVSAAPSEYGSVVPDRRMAAVNDTVSLSVTPVTGYVLGEITADHGKVKAASDGTYTLTVDNGNFDTVTVCATFRKIEAEAGRTVVASGTCGPNAYWYLYNDGELCVSGMGAMSDYSYYYVPWYTYRDQIRVVTVESGISRLGTSAFSCCDKLAYAVVDRSVAADRTPFPSGKDIFYGGSSGPSDSSSYWHTGVTDFREDQLVSVSVTCYDGGQVKVTPKLAVRGERMILPVYPNAGYTLRKLTVDNGTVDGYIIDLNDQGSYDTVNIRVEFGPVKTGTAPTASGVCGPCLSWSYYSSSGELFICGTGAMYSYSSNTGMPWSSYKTSINSIHFDDSVTTIGDYAFAGLTKLQQCVLPEGMRTVGANSFNGCTALWSVTVPTTLTSFGRDAFNGCTAMTRVNISDLAAWCRVSFPNANGSPLYYGKKLYLNNALVTDLVIPDSIKTIKFAAFYNCTSITSVTIPDSVTSIMRSAFNSCTGLKSVTVPDSVTKMEDYVFEGCTGLTSATLGKGITSVSDYTFHNCSALKSVALPDAITSIGTYAFSGCSSLTGLSIPNSVTNLGTYAFNGCSSLTSLRLPESIPEVPAYLCQNCTSLRSVTLGSKLTAIQNYAFDTCIKLKRISIPEGVTTIGGYAFKGNSSLLSVDLPLSLTAVNSNAFYGCSSLQDVYYPGTSRSKITISSSNDPLTYANWHYECNIAVKTNVTGFGAVIFDRMLLAKGDAIAFAVEPGTGWTLTGISTDVGTLDGQTLTLPASGSYTAVTIAAEFTEARPGKTVSRSGSCGSNVYWYLYDDGELYLGGSGATADYSYSSSVPWYSYTSSVKAVTVEPGITALGENLFRNCGQMVSAAIPASVTSVGSYAFGSCTALEDVYYEGASRNGVTFADGNTSLQGALWRYDRTFEFRPGAAAGSPELIGSAVTVGVRTDTPSTLICAFYDGTGKFMSPSVRQVDTDGASEYVKLGAPRSAARTECFLLDRSGLWPLCGEDGAGRLPTYKVQIGSFSGGAVYANKMTDLAPGETVTLTPAPGKDRFLTAISCTGPDQTTVKLTKNTSTGNYTFRMPAGDVTVSATFKTGFYALLDYITTNGTYVSGSSTNKAIEETRYSSSSTIKTSLTYLTGANELKCICSMTFSNGAKATTNIWFDVTTGEIKGAVDIMYTYPDGYHFFTASAPGMKKSTYTYSTVLPFTTSGNSYETYPSNYNDLCNSGMQITVPSMGLLITQAGLTLKDIGFTAY